MDGGQVKDDLILRQVMYASVYHGIRSCLTRPLFILLTTDILLCHCGELADPLEGY